MATGIIKRIFNLNDLGLFYDADGLNRKLNYCGLLESSGQYYFLQIGGTFAVQLRFGNQMAKGQYRINYNGNDWSSIAWEDM